MIRSLNEIKRWKIIKLQILEYQVDPHNPHAPVAQKVANEVVFRRFQGEGAPQFSAQRAREGLKRLGA